MSQPTSPTATPAPGPRRPAWRTIVWIAVVIGVALAVAFILSRCAGGGSSAFAGRPTITVGIAKATIGDVPITVTALGTVTPEATVQVTTKVNGTLETVAF